MPAVSGSRRSRADGHRRDGDRAHRRAPVPHMCTHARCAGRHHARAAKATAHAARTRDLRRHTASQWQRLARALRNARSGRARAPKAPPEWKGRPSAQRGHVCILMAKSMSRRNAGNASTSVKSRGRRVFGRAARGVLRRRRVLAVAGVVGFRRLPRGSEVAGRRDL